MKLKLMSKSLLYRVNESLQIEIERYVTHMGGFATAWMINDILGDKKFLEDGDGCYDDFAALTSAMEHIPNASNELVEDKREYKFEECYPIINMLYEVGEFTIQISRCNGKTILYSHGSKGSWQNTFIKLYQDNVKDMDIIKELEEDNLMILNRKEKMQMDKGELHQEEKENGIVGERYIISLDGMFERINSKNDLLKMFKCNDEFRSIFKDFLWDAFIGSRNYDLPCYRNYSIYFDVINQKFIRFDVEKPNVDTYSDDLIFVLGVDGKMWGDFHRAYDSMKEYLYDDEELFYNFDEWIERDIKRTYIIKAMVSIVMRLQYDIEYEQIGMY